MAQNHAPSSQNRSIACQTEYPEEYSLSSSRRDQDLDATFRSYLTEGSECPSQLNEALAELCELHTQIKRHSTRLTAWDAALRKRETALDTALHDADRRIAAETERRFQRGREQQKTELRVLESQLKEKVSENERLQRSFVNLRESYEKVKSERTELQTHCAQLEKKLRALQGRLRNLQQLPRKEDTSQPAAKDNNDPEAKDNNHPAVKDNNQYAAKDSVPQTSTAAFKGPVALALREVVSWVTNSLLEPLVTSEELPQVSNEAIDCCLRLLPRVTDLLQLHVSRVSGLQLDRRLHSECLVFLHFAFMLLERHEPSKKRKIACTQHRLGEALHKELVRDLQRTSGQRMSPTNFAVTCCLVLQTVSQADLLLHTWAQLRQLIASGARGVFSQLRGPRFVSQRMTALCAPAELPKALDLLLCFGADLEVEEELLSELGRPGVLRLLAETLRGPREACVKEKFVILLQHVLKRPHNEPTARLLVDLGVVRALESELAACKDSAPEEVSSYEIVLEATLALLVS